MLIVGLSKKNSLSSWVGRMTKEGQPETPAPEPPAAEPAKPGPKEYLVPDSKMGWLDKRIAQLNKFVASINAQGAKFGGEQLKPIVMKVLGPGKIKVDEKKDIWIPAKRVMVEGEAPRIKGWTFAATLVPLGDPDDPSKYANIIKSVPGAGEVPPEYRTAPPKCDYCQTTRRRLETYLLRNDAGEVKQVGRNCLAKFLNTTSPEGLADMASAWADLVQTLESFEGEPEGWEGGGGGRERAVGIGTFVAMAVSVTRSVGWTSRSKAAEGSRFGATADVAWLLLTDRGYPAEFAMKMAKEGIQKPLEHRPEDQELATKAIEWARDLKNQASETMDDYLWNLSAAASQPVVTPSTAGLVASVVSAYQRATAKVDSSSMGQAIFFGGKVTQSKPTKTGSTLWEFENDRGEKVIWFDNKHALDAPLMAAKEKGEKVYFEGVLQKVSTYMGQEQKQVILKRLVSEKEFFEGAKASEEAAKKKDELKASAPPLVPGTKIQLKLTVMDAKTFPGFRGGTTTVYRFVDEFGRRFSWKTSTLIELEQGKTYDCKVTVGWEKIEGTNKPSLDAAGNKQLGHDKYDPQAVKLDKVDPIAVEGKAMLTKDEIAKQEKEVNKLHAESEALQRAAMDAGGEFRDALTATLVHDPWDYERRSLKPENIQSELAKVREELSRAQAAKGEAEFKPAKTGVQRFDEKAEALARRLITADELQALAEGKMRGLEAAVAKVKSEVVPAMEQLLARFKALEEQARQAAKARGTNWPEPSDFPPEYEQIKPAFVDLARQAQSILEKSSGPRHGSSQLDVSRVSGYRMEQEINNLKGLSPRNGGAEYVLEAIAKARAEGRQVDVPSLRAYDFPTEAPKPVTPDEFVALASRLLAKAEEAAKAIPILHQKYDAASVAAKAARDKYEAAEGVVSDMREQKLRGRAKEANSWVSRNCKFAQEVRPGSKK